MIKLYNKLKRLLNEEKGLTLVELLAVIVILGIISSIAVPSIGGIIQKTKNDATVAEAIQIIKSAKLAHASNATDTEWNYNDLSVFIENVKDQEFTVTYENREYSIEDHDVENLEDITDSDNDGVTEQELFEYTGN